MTAQDPNDIPAQESLDDPEAAMRDARQRFIAAFPKRSDSIGLMLAVVVGLFRQAIGDGATATLLAVSLLVLATRRLDPTWLIAGGALAGWLLGS